MTRQFNLNQGLVWPNTLWAVRVLVAISGGVDSAVAAARMIEQGHEVVGVHLGLGHRLAPADQAVRDAQAVADRLGIALELWDYSAQFATQIVAHFVSTYAAGRTPNPCLRCNPRLKFGVLLERSAELGFDAVASGHYARLLRRPGQDVELHRATDDSKDQSYVLATLSQQQLRRCLFPLGDSLKSQVRREAADLGFEVADKADSTDVCFISDGDVGSFLDTRLGSRSGPIVDTAGVEVGTHQGAHRFTIGQRRGLRLGAPAEDGEPRYVVNIDSASNTVVVGKRADLLMGGLIADDLRWNGSAQPSGRIEGLAQVRAHGTPIAATFAFDAQGLTVSYHQPSLAVAPGQGVACYQQTRVLGCASVVSNLGLQEVTR